MYCAAPLEYDRATLDHVLDRLRQGAGHESEHYADVLASRLLAAGYGPGEMDGLSVQALYPDKDSWDLARSETSRSALTPPISSRRSRSASAAQSMKAWPRWLTSITEARSPFHSSSSS